jgi:hypothetical protein
MVVNSTQKDQKYLYHQNVHNQKKITASATGSAIFIHPEKLKVILPFIL